MLIDWSEVKGSGQELWSLTWRAAGLSMMTSAACLSDLLALCSPSAAITLARAFRAASASAAMALWSCSGTLTSFTSTLSTLTPQGSVPSSNTVWCKVDIIEGKCNHDLSWDQKQTFISFAMASLLQRMSPRVIVPSTFLRVVAANSLADPL